MNWYEQLGRAIATEAVEAGTPLQEGAPIDHQTGTVWVPSTDGQVIAISTMKTEELAE